MKPSQTQDLYARLKIAQNASPEELKKAYRLKAFESHPDRNKEEDAEQQFKAIAEAYDTLSDPVKRGEYDQVYWIFKDSKELNAPDKKPKEDIEEMLKTCGEDFDSAYTPNGRVKTWYSKGAKIDVCI